MGVSGASCLFCVLKNLLVTGDSQKRDSLTHKTVKAPPLKVSRQSPGGHQQRASSVTCVLGNTPQLTSYLQAATVGFTSEAKKYGLGPLFCTYCEGSGKSQPFCISIP